MVPAGALFDFVSKEGSGVCSFCRICGAGVHAECPRRSFGPIHSIGSISTSLFAAIVQQQDS